MKARFWLVLLAVAIWAAIIVIIGRDRPATLARPLPVAAAEAEQLQAQARVLCARRRGPGYIRLPDGWLVCEGAPGPLRDIPTPTHQIAKAQP